ncbi:unnamed protein product [Periconia digitata]|uniref:Zn(2)-C6 fungal-type domain-containing protein n=1 Tax=Periconia digitata TaxID=1303443 RepID=A0A9W4U422_9PLEO|nr:unnamed protein product [Periconia digitata]
MTPGPPEKRPRRAHVKSRSGCHNCKKRKVKCGEERPSCRNCSRRGESCDLPDQPVVTETPAARPPESCTGQTIDSGHNEPAQSVLSPSVGGFNASGSAGSHGLTLLDMELLHHYSISTHRTISSDPIVREWFLVNVPQLGFSHPYVLYSVLALSASHLAHFRPKSRRYYYAEATSRHTLATSLATPLLSNISTANLIPMYAFSTLTMFISFANLNEEYDLFFDANNVIPTWLTLFRGIRTVLESNDRAVLSSSISFLFHDRQDTNTNWESRKPNHDALKEFQDHIASEDEYIRNHLSDAFDNLRSAFYAFYGEDLSIESKVRSIFTWLYRIPDEYIDLLRRKNQKALCILAFFCVLLHRLEYNWWLKGWGTHLIDRIYTALDEVHRFLIRWPIQEIGWVP